MSQPYVGEIRMFAGNFAPAGWALCDGQLMAISENETLFNLIGTTYGGDGQETFALPDLAGRIPIHQSSSSIIGTSQGTESVTLGINQIPNHTHTFQAYNATANSPNPSGNLLGLSTQGELFYADTPGVNLNAQAVSQIGGNQPHENMMPFLCLNFIISLYGIYPSPN